MAAIKTMDDHGVDVTAASPMEFHALGGSMLNPLALLLHVETLDGSPLPENILTIPNHCDLSIKCGEEEPFKVELLSAYEACLTYKEDVIITNWQLS